MRLKVCGITGYEQMQQLQELGVDYAGMIFYQKSKRYAGNIAAEERERISRLEIKKVGAFVNSDYDAIVKAVNEYGLYAVQLHGDETDEFCLELMDKVKVIKVFRIAGQHQIDELVEPFEAVSHYFLFDTETKTYGGSGKQFDWKVLENTTINKPFFLSGGIGLNDAEKLKAFRHSYFYAVDVNSRFETEPGQKDLKQIEAFVNLIGHE